MSEESGTKKSSTIREGRVRAQIALLDVIRDAVEELRGNGYSLNSQASTIMTLATAYRAIEGGHQPHSSAD